MVDSGAKLKQVEPIVWLVFFMFSTRFTKSSVKCCIFHVHNFDCYCALQSFSVTRLCVIIWRAIGFFELSFYSVLCDCQLFADRRGVFD